MSWNHNHVNIERETSGFENKWQFIIQNNLRSFIKEEVRQSGSFNAFKSVDQGFWTT